MLKTPLLLMLAETDYTEIAPYQDHEVGEVLDQLKKNPAFHKLLQFMDIDPHPKAIDQLFSPVKTIDDFQANISKPWILRFLNETTTSVTHHGIENLDTRHKYLFISNHRDIVLDSAILNVLFSEHGIQTIETAIGDNLLKFPIVKKLAKLNKNFTVVRGANPREMYRHSLILSSYIRKKIANEENSIWIAQREGRAKDGNDQTQQGVVKMLTLSNKEGFEEGCKSLRIRPLSLSYEYDPCDRYKVKELLAREAGEAYVKEEEEDFINIIAGFIGQKGRIHLRIQPVLDQEIDQLSTINNINEKINKLAKMIDHSIYLGYQLFENNYIAHDLLHKTSQWKSHYTEEQKKEFEEYAREVCHDLPPRAQKILFSKYAYPLINQLSAL